MPRIGAIERLVAEGEVGNDVALDRCLEERPLEPGWVTQMAAPDESAAIKPHPYKHITTERFDKSETFTRLPGTCALDGNPNRAVRQPLQNLLDQRKALPDLADAHPDPCVD